MNKGHLDRLVEQAGVPGLLDALVHRLSPTDLQSLLLEVYRQRAKDLTPARIREKYGTDRFVCPAAVPPQEMLEVDRTAFALACPPFEAVELSPVCPLGTIAALGDVSQDWAVPTVRNKEVVSDSTNCLALECAVRRTKDGAVVRLCASHRLLRPQLFSGAGSFAHFKVFALTTAGQDEGNLSFELSNLLEHVRFHTRLLLELREQGRPISSIKILLTAWESSNEDRLREAVIPQLEELPHTHVSLKPDRPNGRDYYDRFCFEIRAADAQGQEFSLVDGGFTDWTAKLLSNKKERLMISGMGTERLASCFPKTS